MRIFVRSILLFLFTLVAMKSFGQVRVEQSIDSVEIRVGEQAQLKLNVTIAKGNSLRWPLLKERQYLVPGLEIVQLEPADTIHEDGEQLTIEKKYTLTAFETFVFYSCTYS